VEREQAMREGLFLQPLMVKNVLNNALQRSHIKINKTGTLFKIKQIQILRESQKTDFKRIVIICNFVSQEHSQ
jgi:hydroxymethylpyrimidine/phosphomethylpyrimidine kinase